MEELINTHSDVVGRLAFKYMVRSRPSPFVAFLEDLCVVCVCLMQSVASVRRCVK